ncbi:MAG: type II secretion system protein [bacterium]|nr:type II secretion system protein [bacterium]
MKRDKKGFTLIELLVVIAIIGILATIVLVSLNTARAKARDVRRIGDIRQIALALEMYYDDNTTTGYPGDADAITCDDWAALVIGVEGGVGYMTQVPHDPTTTRLECNVGAQNVDQRCYMYNAFGATINDYVLKARLEQTANQALTGDIDGTVQGCNCGVAATDNIYCIQP